MFDQAYQAFLDSGDIIWASFLTYTAVWLHLENGDPLSQVSELARRYASFNERSHNDVVCIVDRVEGRHAHATCHDATELAEQSLRRLVGLMLHQPISRRWD